MGHFLTFGLIHGNVSQMFNTTESVFEKNFLLDENKNVCSFLAKRKDFAALVANMTPECALAVKAALAAGQEHIFAGGEMQEVRDLLQVLMGIEDYFHDLGGIVGYQKRVEELLADTADVQEMEYQPPQGIDFTKHDNERYDAIHAGLENMPQMAEIYPVGGAAERLKNVDGEGNCLPAAPLSFLGRSLLEGLIRDLEAREHLYEKVFGEKIETPIVMMTSSINSNHKIITELLHKANYFGRCKDSFFLFQQPLVPSFDMQGKWVLQGTCDLLMKPGGHGVIWKLALENGVFDWLKSHGRTKLLVRQINNPIAGTDFGLLALMGEGHLHDKAFGFASCERLVGASEGVNVLKKQGDQSTISNIEYCDFHKFGIDDAPRENNDPYSLYSSNTNILFADIDAVEEGAVRNPYPGRLVNFKEGNARLETTMQNIADVFFAKDNAKTFITFNERCKTISTAKKEYVDEGLVAETPYGCFIDYQKNSLALLQECGFSIPGSALFIYSPLLGPLYEVIHQKLCGGVLQEGSELQVSIPDVLLSNIDLQGSLLIEGEDSSSSVILRDVSIRNSGIDWDAPQALWKNEIIRKGVCQVRVGEGAEFVAENITLPGDLHIDVPPFTRWRAVECDGEIVLRQEPLTHRRWNYAFDNKHRIILKRQGGGALLEKFAHKKTLIPK
jgi:UTP---glucose-1-phosphate uridylyltransferase